MEQKASRYRLGESEDITLVHLFPRSSLGTLEASSSRSSTFEALCNACYENERRDG